MNLLKGIQSTQCSNFHLFQTHSFHLNKTVGFGCVRTVRLVWQFGKGGTCGEKENCLLWSSWWGLEPFWLRLMVRSNNVILCQTTRGALNSGFRDSFYFKYPDRVFLLHYKSRVLFTPGKLLLLGVVFPIFSDELWTSKNISLFY